MYVSLLSPRGAAPAVAAGGVAVVPVLRRRRPRSVEQDVQRLTTLRESLAISRAHFSTLFEEERLGRVDLLQAHDVWWSAMVVTEKRRRNYAKFCEGDVYAANAGRHEVTRKMEATVQKSREVEKSRRQALLDACRASKTIVGQHVAHVAGEWKATFRSQQATWQAERHSIVSEQREARKLRKKTALESLESDHKCNAERRRADREAHEDKLSMANRQRLQKAHQRVARVRAEAEGSPMRLLKLEPLTFTLPHRGRSTHVGFPSSPIEERSLVLAENDPIKPQVDSHSSELRSEANKFEEREETLLSERLSEFVVEA